VGFAFKVEMAQQTLAVATHLIHCYLAARSALRELGILRTERTLQGDYAEWLVATFLGLQLTPSTVQKGHDALDAAGRRYQIKSRIVQNPAASTSFDFASNELTFDFLVAVLFSPQLEVLDFIRVPREVVLALGSQTSSSFRFRWNSVTAEHPGVEHLLLTGSQVGHHPTG
jgi:hypothetical protein